MTTPLEILANVASNLSTSNCPSNTSDQLLDYDILRCGSTVIMPTSTITITSCPHTDRSHLESSMNGMKPIKPAWRRDKRTKRMVSVPNVTFDEACYKAPEVLQELYPVESIS